MEVQDLISWIMQLPGVQEDFPFGPTPAVYKVGGKIFALLTVEAKGRIKLSLKCDPVEAVMLRQQYPAIVGGYHLNKKHWNTVDVTLLSNDALTFSMTRHAYELVFNALKKDIRTAINASRATAGK